MNRHEDELEKEIADKYIENMDAPDLWEKIEAGLDAVDAQRVQDKKSGDKKFGVKKDRKVRNRRTIQIVSGLVAAAVVCVLIVAGPLRNSHKRASDKTAQDNSVKVTSDESYYAEESDAAEMADNATASYDVQRNTDAQNSVNSADYIPMIMLDGVLYRDTYDMVDADSVDESKAAYAESYTDGVPANDGEVNFDMNPSRNSAYIVCDDGSLVVKVEGNWYRFERAE